MSLYEFFTDILGISGNYDFIFAIFGVAFGLVVIDSILSFLFGSVNSLFKGGR